MFSLRHTVAQICQVIFIPQSHANWEATGKTLVISDNEFCVCTLHRQTVYSLAMGVLRSVEWV